MKHFALALCLAVSLLVRASPACAIGNAATHFAVFVPPNNDDNGRYSMVIVTAQTSGVSGVTTVTLNDDGADGDTDDTRSAPLARGQSLVVYLRDGAVNDDAGGKWDGDVFDVRADSPVTVLLATRSDWEHDWVPAADNSMLGQSFYLFAPDGTGSRRDVDVIAYRNGTRLRVLDLSTAATLATGVTSVSASGARVVLEATLNEGEDLKERRGLGVDLLVPGRTYLVEASEPVTVISGALDDLGGASQARDGGGFVPSSNGSSTGELFYFIVPHDPGRSSEQEMRIVGYDPGTHVDVAGWDATTGAWVIFRSFDFADAFDHGDIVGSTYKLFRVTATAGRRVSVFEANWLETGAIGTSDVGSYVSAGNGTAAGTDFLAYIPPPGIQSRVFGVTGTYSHLYVFARNAGTTFNVVDADTGGTYFTGSGTAGPTTYGDVRISSAAWTAMNAPAAGRRPYLRLRASGPVTVWNSNHNDNWLSYAASVLPPTPSVSASASASTAACASIVTFTCSVRNPEAGTLYSLVPEVNLGSALEFVSAVDSASGVAPSTRLQAGDGFVTFAPVDLASGQRRDLTVRARVVCTSAVTNGTRMPFTLVARARGAGIIPDEPLASAATDVVVVEGPRSTVFASIAATPSGATVRLQFATLSEARATRFQVLRATGAAGTEAAVGAAIAPLGTADTGASYVFTDTAVTTGTTYFYRVRAELDDGSRVFSEITSARAGDTVAPDVPTLFAAAGDNRVSLSFMGGNRDGDLAGYELERADNGGAFVRVVAGRITASTFVDLGALDGVTCRYHVRAVDTSGNASAWSADATVTPTAPSTSVSAHTVAFEDRLGAESNDWDYNDLVADVTATETFSGGAVSAYAVVVEPVARGARYDHALRLGIAVNGPWSATVDTYATRAAMSSAPLSSRTTSGVGTVDVELFADTRTALPPAPGEWATNTYPDAPDVAGQVAVLRVTLLNTAANPAATRPAAPYDLYLRLTRPAVGDIHGPSSSRFTEERVGPTSDGPTGSILPLSVTYDGTLARWSAEAVPTWRSFPTFEALVRGAMRLPASAADDHAAWLVRARRH